MVQVRETVLVTAGWQKLSDRLQGPPGFGCELGPGRQFDSVGVGGPGRVDAPVDRGGLLLDGGLDADRVGVVAPVCCGNPDMDDTPIAGLLPFGGRPHRRPEVGRIGPVDETVDGPPIAKSDRHLPLPQHHLLEVSPPPAGNWGRCSLTTTCGRWQA